MALDIEASETLVLECGRCGERLVLLGREDDWLAEDRRTFACGGCGRALPLGARVVPGGAVGSPRRGAAASDRPPSPPSPRTSPG